MSTLPPSFLLSLLIINRINPVSHPKALPLRLDSLAFNTPATISHIDWAAVSDKEGRRLRELGFAAGMSVEALHGGLFAKLIGGGPLACRIGRMTVAIRRSHAAAIEVMPA